MRLVSSSSAHADADADVEAVDVDAYVVAYVGGAIVNAAGGLSDALQQLPVRQVAEKCASATDVAVVVVGVVVVAGGGVVVVVGGGDGVAGGQKGLGKRHHCRCHHRRHAGWDGI